MAMHSVTELWINKQQLNKTQVEQFELDDSSLGEGQVLLRNDYFGFSSNNVTYALLGDRMGYWGFFPAAEGWGKVPVWGFAVVEASNHPDIKVGERVYGYLPSATHLVISADKVNANGFMDVDAGRKSISPVYDHYQRCDADPGYVASKEDWQLIFRPLFMTSFVLDDFVSENLPDEPTTIVLTSASSKTAFGCAFLLRKLREQRGQDYRVVGLTSPGNVDFVNQTECYDEVLSYDQVGQLDTDRHTITLDFAGNKNLLLSLAQHLGEQLAPIVFIGVTDVGSQANKSEGEVEGNVFFAPSQVKKRHQDWGHDGFNQRYAEGWIAFTKHAHGFMVSKDYQGTEDLNTLYMLGLAGKLGVADMNCVRF